MGSGNQTGCPASPLPFDGFNHWAHVTRYKPKISNRSSWIRGVRLSTLRVLRLNDHGVTNQASLTCYIEEIANTTGPALRVTVGTIHTATVLTNLLTKAYSYNHGRAMGLMKLRDCTIFSKQLTMISYPLVQESNLALAP
ncbi:uncharacterized protein LACBIDRAFT_321385 [Laccaria bicolor S238N-H82]|uniref:Predicted protein n=1 Tax=Laccaria bicolor (strain S238N-H82 / ATCC MYA-4686) TaxID=486041 RepID=B0CQ05_LACBS|nr:uncharacterized protein LACBIDRAFT_321385 [Laccaria bicolor S238N-H82]EDR15507.1 predicted protein [Laccaria bicolor S238N-H82]|eukprot:XP_001873715.1 predicted protein [Laccaria bicolor S238N-H82]